MNYSYAALLGVLSLVTVLGFLAIPQAHAQVQPEIDIKSGASSNENASCVAGSNCFSPNPMHIFAGETVVWKNMDSVSHTITSVNSLCNGPHMTIQIATDIKSIDPTVMIRTSLTGMTYAKLAKDQPYAQENVNADIRRLVYEAYVSPVDKSFEVVVSEGIGHNTYSVQKEVQVAGCTVGSVFDSGAISPQQTFAFTFAEPGNYNYFCTIHPWLMGQVIVDSVTNNSTTQQTQSSAIPEFPFAVPVMVTGIVSVIVFYRMKSHIW